jgi:hypothetical protein
MRIIARQGFYPGGFLDDHRNLINKGLPPKDKFQTTVKPEGILPTCAERV